MGSVKLKPISTIVADFGLEPTGDTQQFFTNACYRYMDKYVPMSDLQSKGDLRTQVNIGNDYIEYEMPYAHYQYVGHREDGSHVIKRHTTLGTTTYWDKKMWSVEKENIEREVQEYISRKG